MTLPPDQPGYQPPPPAPPTGPAYAAPSAPPPGPAPVAPTSPPYAAPAGSPGPVGGSPTAAFSITGAADRSRELLVALGTGLIFAAVLVSSAYARARHHLDASLFVVGLAATLVLLALAGAGYLLLGGRTTGPAGTAGSVVEAVDPDRDGIVSWPGAFGAIGVGLLIGEIFTNDKVAAYLGGLLILAISVGGYLLVRRAPFVLSAIAGLLIVYGRLAGQVLGGGSATGDNVGIKVGAAVLVFVAVVTLLGWLLPTRVISGVTVGVFGLVAMNGVLVALIAIRAFTRAFRTFSPDGSPSVDGVGRGGDPYVNDVYFVIAFSVLLAVLWAWAALQSGHVGFRILVLAVAVTVLPLASAALMTAHPTWWGVAPLIVGALVVGAVALTRLRASRAPQQFETV